MNTVRVWILAHTGDPGLKALPTPSASLRMFVGDTIDAFRTAPFQPDVIFACIGLPLLQEVWNIVNGVHWIHCRFAGVDHVLFPELVESDILLTNARGIFSSALSEFALGAMLFFAKDFRRMIENQSAGRWSPFLVGELAGKTLGIVGYGDIGQAAAKRAKAFGMRVVALRR